MWLVKVLPESKVTPRFLTVSVGEIEFPRSWVGNFGMWDSLACLSPIILNYVFSGMKLFTIIAQFKQMPEVQSLFKSHYDNFTIRAKLFQT